MPTAITNGRSVIEDAHIYDLVCVGFGPASLAIAVAIHDQAISARVLYLERQREFRWHGGMLLPDTKMQISFLKDLATLRNPRSHFTFLNYLHSKDRLVAFTNLATFLPLREEYNDYLTWCASHFDVQYGQETLEITPGHATSGPVQSWEILSRDVVTDQRTTVRARNIVIAVGGKPRMPATLSEASLHPLIIHSSAYSTTIPKMLAQKWSACHAAIVGGGQSAAEIFNDLQSRFAKVSVTLYTGDSALRPSDDSPFVNEIFDPHRVDEFYDLPEHAQKDTLHRNRATNYGVVRPELLDRLYELMYHQRLHQPDESKWQHKIIPRTAVVGYDQPAEGRARLKLKNTLDGSISLSETAFDWIIVATGYVRDAHVTMLEASKDLLETGKYDVGRDYKLSDTLLSILAVRGGEVVESIFRLANGVHSEAHNASSHDGAHDVIHNGNEVVSCRQVGMPTSSCSISMHAGNDADPPPSRAPAEHVAPRNRTGTSFPSLTGRKGSLTDQEPIATATFESKVSFSALQHTARQHHVLPRAIPMLAWARLLELYTASEEDIDFHGLLPWSRDTPANDACRSSLVICTFNVQEQGQVAIGPLISRFNRHVTPDQCVQHKTLSPDEPLGNHQRQGKLLNLENLQHSSANCNLLKDGSHLLAVYAVTLRIQSPPIISEPLSLAISGRVDLIKKGAAQLLLAQYDHIMEVIVQCPDESLGRVHLHAPDSLLSISNPQPVVSIEYSSLQSQFENVARSDPQQVALEFWTRQRKGSLQPDTLWTYAELDSRAEKIAAELEDRFGSLIGHIVPLCMDRCPEIYAAILGILKAGAAWCPIDPSYPPLRRHELITRTAAKVLVVNAQSPRDGVPENVSAVNLTRLEGSSSKPLNRFQIQPDSLAYLIWTSGTTGAPKGVPISHHAATASMRALQVGIPTDVKPGRVRCLQFSQFTFDVFVQDLFYTWGVGGTLIAADRTSMLGSFAELATGSQATHAHLTPAFAASVPREHCPTLEVVTMIGEKLTQNVAHDWSQDCRLYNTYGPAEATVVATFRRVPHEDDVQSANVGLPLPSVSAFVIHDGQLMLKGGIGELALGGPQLSNGYWKDSAKTKQCFVWNERLQCILYMTGDVVRQLQDGTFEFVGRNDDLIKIQGIRVELSEIAFALRSCHPEVRQVEVAFLERHDRPSKVIVAFLAAPTSNRCDTGIVDDDYGVEVARAALEMAKIQLPTYMIPKVFLVLHEIPRTSSAKVDRNSIQRLYANVDLGAWEKKLGSAGNGNNSVADLDPREVMIVEIISGLTGTSKESMSRHSTLQSLGVDSITATRLVTRLSSQDAAVSIVDILQCSTLEELFHCARREYTDTIRRLFDLSAFHQDAIGSLTPDLANRVEIVMPTLPFQESLLSESFQNPVSYWSHNLFQLETDVNLKKLEEAWHDIAQCTEALRASFCPVADVAGELRIESTFLQLINRDICVDWIIISATDRGFEVAARQRARGIAELRQEERFVQPLWAVTVICLESRNFMMLSIHHAIRDDRSVQTIMADLQQAYLDNDTQQMQRRYQIRDAVSLLYTADTDSIERDEKFWSESLSPFNDGVESRSWPELKLVDDGQNEGTVTCCWDAADSYNNLRIKAAGISAASLAAVLRVVWGCILLEYLETDRVVFGETWSARSDVPGLSDTVAPLVSVLPVPFQAQPSWQEMLQRTSNFHQQSKDHRGVHPRSIRKILRRVDDEALYPAVFNF
ncbi:MAG: hypothetical protein LQ341_003131, partial [Variospora aurantia]